MIEASAGAEGEPRANDTGGGLQAVLFNPPTGDGSRTLARVRLAAKILGHDAIGIANLFPIPTASVLEVNELGVDPMLWKTSREAIAQTLAGASDVLLAYGCQEPLGVVRHHFRAQVAWLHHELARVDARLWSVSPEPRHPSRWQRHTSRCFPELPFNQALAASLQRVP